MKRIICLTSSIFILILMFTSCSSKKENNINASNISNTTVEDKKNGINYSSKSFDDLLGTNEANITKVFMRNGNTGSYVETTDKEKIKELINFFNDRYYKKSLNQESRSGYTYYYDFYSKDKQIIRITGTGENVEVNDTYCNVSKTISNDSITNWFNSLPVNADK